MARHPALSEADAAWLRETGRDPEEAAGQLALLARGGAPARLVRPATVGDGITAQADLPADAAVGPVSFFVPASGAATRMAAALVRAWQGADLSPDEAGVVAAVTGDAPALALWPALVAHGARAGDPRAILAALVGPEGVGLAGQPKALVPFHVEDGRPVTALEAQLAEASAVAGGRPSVHVTVSPEHLDEVRALVAGADAEVTLSVQHPATDTLALSADGELVRDADGHPLVRPGGHGALLRNLAAVAASGAEVVLVKNIDNVAPARDRAAVAAWRRRVAGALVGLVADGRAAWDALHAGRSEIARGWVRERLGIDASGEALAAVLDRPWRVCAMVRNTGQPGGGPFWAHGPDGVGLQIVEAAQVGPDQRHILAAATHFNPVDMALHVRRFDGRPHDLRRFTDPDAVIVTGKTHAGQRIRVLEHPGLWNGQMARWNTVFVEVPAETFRPVKTLADLLGPLHRG